jgi:hypothetical protein
MMTQAEKAVICWAGALVLCAGAIAGVQAESVDNQYESIITNRNIFALRTPPPPDPNASKSATPPPPKILLTGITTILGEPLALLKWTPPVAKGEQAKEKSFTLSVGEREDDVEVRRIDITKGMVEVDDYGVITNLTFEKDAPKGGGGPPAPGGPPPPNNHGGAPPNPLNQGTRPFPQRGMRTLQLPGGGNAGASSSRGGVSVSGGPATSTGAGGASINVGGNNLSLTGGAPQSGQPIIAGQDLIGGDMSEEAYAALLEAQREATAEDVKSGKMAPLPITRYTPSGALGTLPDEESDASSTTTTTGTTTTPTPHLPGRPFHPY